MKKIASGGQYRKAYIGRRINSAIADLIIHDLNSFRWVLYTLSFKSSKTSILRRLVSYLPKLFGWVVKSSSSCYSESSNFDNPKDRRFATVNPPDLDAILKHPILMCYYKSSILRDGKRKD